MEGKKHKVCFKSHLCTHTRMYFGKGVHSKNGKVRLGLGIVHEVEIDQFLQLQVVGLHAVDYVSK